MNGATAMLEAPEHRIGFTLYVGSPEPFWLSRAGFPLFVSRNRLCRIKKFRPAAARWALDSGGFSEISRHGRWTTPPRQFAEEVNRWQGEIGLLDWAAVQDWMCEPDMLRKTGLTIAEHQRRTCLSYLQLRDLAPRLPWTPVLQGWSPGDYYRHFEAYAGYGVDLRELAVVGIGSVCRRQHTDEAEQTIKTLRSWGVKLHGFGFKKLGLARVWQHLCSSDSMAWSDHARKNHKKVGLCSHSDCRNCICAAAEWRDEVLQALFDTLRACPECGATEVCPPSHDAYFHSCVSCGHAWPVHVSNKMNGFDLTPL